MTWGQFTLGWDWFLPWASQSLQPLFQCHISIFTVATPLPMFTHLLWSLLPENNQGFVLVFWAFSVLWPSPHRYQLIIDTSIASTQPGSILPMLSALIQNLLVMSLSINWAAL